MEQIGILSEDQTDASQSFGSKSDLWTICSFEDLVDERLIHLSERLSLR